MKLKCSRCGKVTDHYKSSTGECRCLVCNTVNKTVKVKNVEVVFEAGKELDAMLNPSND